MKKWSRKKTAAQKEVKAMEAPERMVRAVKSGGVECADGLGVAEGCEGFEGGVRCWFGRWACGLRSFGGRGIRVGGLGGIVEVGDGNGTRWELVLMCEEAVRKWELGPP